MYKKFALAGERIDCPIGQLSLKDVYELPLASKKETVFTLPKLVKHLNSKLPVKTEGLDFLEDDFVKVDEIAELKFNIVKDIYLTKKAEEAAATSKSAFKSEEQKLLSALKDIEDKELLSNPAAIKARLAELRGSAESK